MSRLCPGAHRTHVRLPEWSACVDHGTGKRVKRTQTVPFQACLVGRALAEGTLSLSLEQKADRCYRSVAVRMSGALSPNAADER